MKQTLTFIVFIVISIIVVVSCQEDDLLLTTYVGDLTISSQAEVDSFAYTHVKGDLTIKYNNKWHRLFDLEGLRDLEFVREILKFRIILT